MQKKYLPFTPAESTVATALLGLGSGNDSTRLSGDLFALGDDVFAQVADLLTKRFPELADAKTEAKTEAGTDAKTESKRSRRDTISFDIACTQARIAVQSALPTLNPKKLMPQSMLAQDVCEYRAIGFLYMLKWVQTNTAPLDVAIPAVTAARRFATVMDKYCARSRAIPSQSAFMSRSVLRALQTVIAQFPEYTLDEMKHAPGALVATQWDSAIPGEAVRPRPFQTRIMEILREITTNGVMIFNRVPLSGGKSVTILAIANWLRMTRSSRHLIFACAVPSVLTQVDRWLSLSGITTHLITVDENIKSAVHDKRQRRTRRGGPLVLIDDPKKPAKKAPAKRSEAKRIATICDMVSLDGVLDECGVDDILIIDEFNAYLDIPDHPQIGHIINVWGKMPRTTCLMSATLPAPDEFKELLEDFRSRWGGITVTELTSTEMFLPCEVRTFGGQLILPHMVCRTPEDVISLAERISGNLSLVRMYTPKAVADLARALHADIPTDITANRLAEYTIALLKRMAETPAAIATVCVLPGEAKTEAKAEEFDWSTLVSAPETYPGITMIGHADPLRFAVECTPDTPADLKLATIIRRHQSALEAYAKKVETFNKRNAHMPFSSRPQYAEPQPVLAFPDRLQIDTASHRRSMSKDEGGARKPYYPIDLVAPEDLLVLAFRGIVVLSERMPPEYRRYADDMIQRRHVKYIFMDGTYAYGS